MKTETIPCTPSEFLEFVPDIEGYAKVDDEIAKGFAELRGEPGERPGWPESVWVARNGAAGA